MMTITRRVRGEVANRTSPIETRAGCDRTTRSGANSTWSKVGIPILTLAVISLLGASGCGRNNEAKNRAPQVRVGVVLPLTGEASSYGVDCRRGIELAASLSGSQIQLIFEDSKADPKQAVSSMQRLIAQHKVVAVIGDMFSSTTLSIAPIAQENKIVLLTPTASDPRIPATGDQVFSIYPPAHAEGGFMARNISKDQLAKVAILKQNADVFNSIADGFAAVVKERGGVVVVVEQLPESATAFRTSAAKLLSHKPSCVYISAYRDGAVGMIAAIRELSMNVPIYSQSTLQDEVVFETFPDQLQGVVFTGPYFSNKTDDKNILSFQRAYEQTFKTAPSVWSAYGHDACMMIMEALTKAKNRNLDLSSALAGASYEGTTGRTQIQPDRTADKLMLLYRIQGKTFTIYIPTKTE